MVESPIPQDILKYKAKFVGNFSAREAAFLTAGGVACMYGVFGLFNGMETTMRIACSALLGSPFFAFGFIKPLGQPIEKVAGVFFYDNFLCPQVRRKEVRHPELEKYEKTRKWLIAEDDDAQSGSEEGNNVTRKKSSKSKQSAAKKSEIKIKASKEFKGIK